MQVEIHQQLLLLRYFFDQCLGVENLRMVFFAGVISGPVKVHCAEIGSVVPHHNPVYI